MRMHVRLPRGSWFARTPAAVLAGLLSLVTASSAYADVSPLPIEGGLKAIVLSALAGLIILGFGMVALTWLGARVVQRYRHGSSTFQPTPRPTENDWAKKPPAEEPVTEKPSDPPA
jgi:hypothetical protein